MVFPGINVMLALLTAGLVVGAVSGMVGIGGGVLIIPILMIGFDFPQAKANGTSMAMLLPPIGIFAVMSYWRAGNVELSYATILAVGFAVGAYFGAKAVNTGLIHPTALRVLFAILLLYIAGRVLFRSGGRASAALQTALLIAAYTISYAVMRLFGRKLARKMNWSQEYQKRQRVPFTFDYEI